MLIKCTRMVRFEHPENPNKKVNLKRGFIGDVPSWVEHHWYFDALCKDGSITVINGKSDKDISAAVDENPQDKNPDTPPATPETKLDTPNEKKASGGKK